jgi:alkylhydroperoxidase/carboxymuconolactone decarboxylase family protein YurZ
MPKPPEFYRKMKEEHPELVGAYEALGSAALQAGPLDAKTAALAKLALGIGASMEGSTHSSVRKALAAGATPDEIRHVAYLAVTTLGFPAMMRARAWVDDVLGERS